MDNSYLSRFLERGITIDPELKPTFRCIFGFSPFDIGPHMLHLEIANFAYVCMRRKMILMLISKEINFNRHFCCISNIYLTPYCCEV